MPKSPATPFRVGDIVACYGTGVLSRAISLGTASAFAPPGLRIGPSHVAMIVTHEGELRWAESTTLATRPCLIRDARVKGWQLHPIVDRVADYLDAGGRCELYRLHPFYRLHVGEIEAFREASVDYWTEHVARYDAPTALFSGSRIVRLLKLYKPADLNALFCSEYCAAVLRRIGRLPADANPGRYSPARLLRELVKAGTYRFEASTDRIAAGLRFPRVYDPAA
jgi:hypothetical protein